MTKIILSTGNVMSAGPSIVRKTGSPKGNRELFNSLRDSFVAARQDYAADVAVSNGHHTTATLAPAPVEVWTERQNKTLYVPRINWETAGLRDEANQYEITVKIFFLPETTLQERETYVQEALSLVNKELGVKTIDLLIVSFPGLSFEGTCEKAAERINAQQGSLEDELASWKIFEELHRQGAVKRLGVAEFGSEKLRAFTERASIQPSVDQINLRDCCNVPQPLKKLAEEKGIELNVHSDNPDILPRGVLRELLSHGSQGAGVLADAENNGPGLEGELRPQWVAKYVAFIRDRGVIENKGYFAAAELQGSI